MSRYYTKISNLNTETKINDNDLILINSYLNNGNYCLKLHNLLNFSDQVLSKITLSNYITNEQIDTQNNFMKTDLSNKINTLSSILSTFDITALSALLSDTCLSSYDNALSIYNNYLSLENIVVDYVTNVEDSINFLEKSEDILAVFNEIFKTLNFSNMDIIINNFNNLSNDISTISTLHNEISSDISNRILTINDEIDLISNFISSNNYLSTVDLCSEIYNLNAALTLSTSLLPVISSIVGNNSLTINVMSLPGYKLYKFISCNVFKKSTSDGNYILTTYNSINDSLTDDSKIKNKEQITGTITMANKDDYYKIILLYKQIPNIINL